MEVDPKNRLTVLDTEEILYQSEVEKEKRRLKENWKRVKRELSEVYQVDPEHIDVSRYRR